MGRVAQGGVRACEIVKAKTIQWDAKPSGLCAIQGIQDEVKLSHFRCRCQLLCGSCEPWWTRDRAKNARDEDSEDEREREGREESRRNRKAQMAARASG